MPRVFLTGSGVVLEPRHRKVSVLLVVLAYVVSLSVGGAQLERCGESIIPWLHRSKEFAVGLTAYRNSD